jgi:hypothetical protein
MGNTPPKKSQSKRLNKPFQPAIGTDIGGVEDVEAKTRDFLARSIVLASGSMVAVTGGYGLITGIYTPLIAVWAVAGPLIGAVVTYYFGPQRNDTG